MFPPGPILTWTKVGIVDQSARRRRLLLLGESPIGLLEGTMPRRRRMLRTEKVLLRGVVFLRGDHPLVTQALRPRKVHRRLVQTRPAFPQGLFGLSACRALLLALELEKKGCLLHLEHRAAPPTAAARPQSATTRRPAHPHHSRRKMAARQLSSSSPDTRGRLRQWPAARRRRFFIFLERVGVCVPFGLKIPSKMIARIWSKGFARTQVQLLNHLWSNDPLHRKHQHSNKQLTVHLPAHMPGANPFLE